jgi:putative DNA methylase
MVLTAALRAENLRRPLHPRQLVALTTFSDLVQEARERVKRDAIAAGLPDNGKALAKVGAGATAYADALGVYLAFALSKLADRGSSLGRWDNADPKWHHQYLQ